MFHSIKTKLNYGYVSGKVFLELIPEGLYYVEAQSNILRKVVQKSRIVISKTATEWSLAVSFRVIYLFWSQPEYIHLKKKKLGRLRSIQITCCSYICDFYNLRFVLIHNCNFDLLLKGTSMW